jgi:hypothetical protein
MKFEFLGNKEEPRVIKKTNGVVSVREVIKEEKSKPEGKIIQNPIRACLIDIYNIDFQTEKTLEEIERKGQFVNYDGDKNFFKENNLRNAGEKTYVISESNDKDKYSKRYCNCTGIIAVGEEKESDKQISFMVHQDPWSFLKSDKRKFIYDLKKAIKEIKNETKENSIDVVVFGGCAGDKDEYKESIRFVSNILTKEFNFDPTIMTGPRKSDTRQTKVYFDTQNRRLYILRSPLDSKYNESYMPHELEEKSKDW